VSVEQYTLKLPAMPRGFHLITEHITSLIAQSTVTTGTAHLFLQHTSASLSINENADPSVREDVLRFMNDLIPESYPRFTHIYEGSDDMPAHLKSMLLGTSLTIPITQGRLALGTWQGIYLGEHRNHTGSRTLIITLQGE
jgi:secondary thiamine-phosphate synthase enzyme